MPPEQPNRVTAMPNRIVREGWIDSQKIDMLDAHEERFFLRLLLKADDYGLYHANPVVLKNTLYPLKDDLRATDCSRWLAACEKAGLVRCYDDPSGRFLEVLNFNQRTRSSKSRFPIPPGGLAGICQTDDGHMSDICQSNDGQMTVKCQSNDGQMTVKCPPYSYSKSYSKSETLEDVPKPKRFVPPTLEEARLCASKIGLPEAEVPRFMAYYEANGWRVGRNPMKSWKAALTHWKLNYEAFRKNSGGSHTSDRKSLML